MAASSSNGGKSAVYSFDHLINNPPPSSYNLRGPSRLGTSMRPGSARPMTSSTKPVNYVSADAKNKVAGVSIEVSQPTDFERERQLWREYLESVTFLSNEDAAGAARSGKNMLRKLKSEFPDTPDHEFILHLAQAEAASGNENSANTLLTQLVANKDIQYAARFRVNLATLAASAGNFPVAIKQLRMALDSLPSNLFAMERAKLVRNIGNVFFEMRQFSDAADQYEKIGVSLIDVDAATSLLICYYNLRDSERMKSSFARLVSLRSSQRKSEEDEEAADDELEEYLVGERQRIDRAVVLCGTLIAPQLDGGFDWVIVALRNAGAADLAAEIELSQVSHFIKEKNFSKALSLLQSSSHKHSATNLAFIYYAMSDISAAEKFAELAVKDDRYNSSALVNKGCVLVTRGELDEAREVFLEAIGVSAEAHNAIFNLGLVNKMAGRYREALVAFEKLQSIHQQQHVHDAELAFNLADIYLRVGEVERGVDGLHVLCSSSAFNRRTDASVLNRLAALFEGDDPSHTQQALHYYTQSYHLNPTDLNVLTWLAVYYVNQDLLERAVEFFKLAAEVDPKDPKWRLMVGSCHRRMGDFAQAFAVYEAVHTDFPDDLEALRCLVDLAQQMGVDYSAFAASLAKLEAAQLDTFGDQSAGHQPSQSPEPLSPHHPGDSLSQQFGDLALPDLGV